MLRISFRLLFFAILGTFFSCGQEDKNKEDTWSFDVKKRTPNKSYRRTSDDRLVEVNISEENSKRDAWLDFGEKALAVWGSSNVVASRVPVEFTKFGRNALNTKSSSLRNTANNVVDRMLSRCGQTLRDLHVTPVDLTLNTDEVIPIAGAYIGIDSWFYYDDRRRAVFFIPSEVQRSRIDIIVHQAGNDIEDSSKTFFELHGFEPWEWDYAEVGTRPSGILGFEPFHGLQSYGDFTLSHEMGHWIVDSILAHNSRLDVETVYFSEVLAQWISGVCYATHMENAEGIVENQNQFVKWGDGIEYDTYWTISNHTLEVLTAPDKIESPLESYLDADAKIYGLGALFAAHVLEDTLDTEHLFKATVESILAMQGRKLKCRPKEEDKWCARTYLHFDRDVFPMESRPLVYTLAEFVENLGARIKIPTKAQKMWDRYLSNLKKVEI